MSVDVTVRGPDGAPVTGLGRESFTVLEDGRPQAIVSFEAVAGRESPVARPATDSPAVAAGAPPPPAPGAAAAHFLIVFAEEQLSARSALAGRRAVERFLETVVRPGERVTLLSTGHGAWTSAVWPADREVMLGQLQDVRGYRIDGEDQNPAGIDPEHPTGFLEDESGEPVAADPLTAPSQRRTPQQLLGRGGYYHQNVDARGFLDQVRRLVDAQPAGGGRLALVLVSEPFFDEAGLAEMRAFLESCRRAHVTVYPLDPSGLLAESDRTDVTTANPGDLETTEDEPVMPDIESAMSDTLRVVMGPLTIAVDTGGFRIRNTNDPGHELRQVASETRNFYRLGYYPPDTARNGGFRRIEVRLAVPNVSVRARRGYYTLPGAPPPPVAPTASAPTSPTDVPAPGPPTAAARYAELVRAYERGEREEALRTLARWEPDDARRASEEASGAEATAGRGPDGRLFREASILLRTEAGFHDVFAGREDRGNALLDGARRDVEALDAGSDGDRFARLWVTAVSRFRRAGGAFDGALALLDQGEARLGRVPELERERALVHLDRALLEEVTAENAPYVLRPSGSLLGRLPDHAPPPLAAVGRGSEIGDATRVGSRSRGLDAQERLEEARRRRVEALELRARESALEAARILRQLARARPDDEDLRLHLGHALLLGERAEESARELEWVASHARDEARRYVALLLLGRIDDEAGRLPAAVERYRAAVALRPSPQAGRVALGAALLRTGDGAGAEEAVLSLLRAPLEPLDDWLVYRMAALPELRTTMQTLWEDLEP